MKLLLQILLLLIIITITSCLPKSLERVPINSDEVWAEERNKEKYNDNIESFGYVPIDPMPLLIKDYDSHFTPANEDYLKALPDESILVATGIHNLDGTISFGPIGGTIKGRKYTVIMDWIKYKTIPKTIIRETDSISDKTFLYFETDNWSKDEKIETNQSKDKNSIPIYAGIGLRLMATFEADSLGMNVSGIFGLSGSFSADKVKGNLIIQSLGVSGKSVSLPLPSEINPTSIQNALMSISQIRALVYTSDAEDIQITPRIVGFYNTVGKVTNRHNMISALSSIEVPFEFNLPSENRLELYEKELEYRKKMFELNEKFTPDNSRNRN
ncbi:hypothetical protein BST97_02305 [Nonlabens spongiae]|uniref:Lipoprotein n=1 Tax=Nonlabens spongiae TaxID=331648 RepID=A0A1W6MH64_9FLAO|nr:hypothetical protein [Nonlabens spongiae]ARN76922.1 hypothetical protein BST97_02305 [Nonlabens spongiae]